MIIFQLISFMALSFGLKLTDAQGHFRLCTVMRKMCHCSFLSCVLGCACSHWWVYSHCEVGVRHIWFSDRRPDEWLLSNSEVSSPSGSLSRPLAGAHPAEQDFRTNLIYWTSDMIWWMNIWDRILALQFALTTEVFPHNMVLGYFHLDNMMLFG